MGKESSRHSHGRSEIWSRTPLVQAIEQERARLGRRLRAARDECKLTQEEAAEICGLHTKSLGNIERGQANATFATIVALARGYQISLRDLFDD